jgi:AbrB family looped-hinge helix DNA binding protein
MKMTQRGQITIPKAIREECGFTPNSEVEVRVMDGCDRHAKARHEGLRLPH